MLEKFRIKITLIATLIVTAYAYFSNKDFLKTCYSIIATIVIFYFLGGFIEIFLKKQIEKIQSEQLKNEQDTQEQYEIYEEDEEDEQAIDGYEDLTYEQEYEDVNSIS